jgi:alpha-ketoglutarate-dependent taurine dioxygenase
MNARSELSKFGYAYLRRHLPGAPTEDIVRSVGIAFILGNGSPVHQLKPKAKEDAPPNTYSGIYGHNRFPLHTDMAHWRYPPRFLLLRCIAGFNSVPTMLVDGAQAIEGIEGIFSRALVRPRRPIEGSLPLLRLYDRQQGDHGLLRWDEVFIRPASRAGEIGIERLRERLAKLEPIQILLVNEGDTLIVDNWRMLHGRAPIPRGCEGRVLERAYLEELY